MEKYKDFYFSRFSFLRVYYNDTYSIFGEDKTAEIILNSKDLENLHSLLTMAKSFIPYTLNDKEWNKQFEK